MWTRIPYSIPCSTVIRRSAAIAGTFVRSLLQTGPARAYARARQTELSVPRDICANIGDYHGLPSSLAAEPGHQRRTSWQRRRRERKRGKARRLHPPIGAPRPTSAVEPTRRHPPIPTYKRLDANRSGMVGYETDHEKQVWTRRGATRGSSKGGEPGTRLYQQGWGGTRRWGYFGGETA